MPLNVKCHCFRTGAARRGPGVFICTALAGRQRQNGLLGELDWELKACRRARNPCVCVGFLGWGKTASLERVYVWIHF